MKEQIDQTEELARDIYDSAFVSKAVSISLAIDLTNKGWKKQREGEWIKQVKVARACAPLLHYYQCSLCGVYLAKRANYCPNCGAKMKGETDERAD